MTKLVIDLSDVAGETHPDDSVVVWSPVHREGSAGRTVSPTQHTIRLTDGVGEREVEPGPLMVQTHVRAIADTRPKEVVVPDQDTVTLWDLLEQDFTYTPPVESGVRRYADRAETAAGLSLGALESIPDRISTAVAGLDLEERMTFQVEESEDTAWAQVTDQGFRLPLGYSPSGHLDEHAKEVFREDVVGEFESQSTSDFSHVTISPEGFLIAGIHQDGRVRVPGLSPTPEGYSVYHRDGELLPAVTDTTNIIGWGSSTMSRMAPHLMNLADSVGASYHDGGKGAEGGDHTAVRIGADPALLTFPDNIIPASGQVQVQSSTDGSSFLKPYAATIGGVHGTVSSVGHDWFFDRTTEGEPVEVEPAIPAHPVLGNRHRASVNLLNIGKNTFDDSRDWATDRVITLTDNAFDWLSPFQKKSLVIGHYVNRDVPDDSIERQQIMDVMAHQKARYGRLYVDLYEMVTTDLAWEYSGVDPTAEDRELQARGNLPASLTEDGGHLNGPGNDAFAKLILNKMISLGWY